MKTSIPLYYSPKNAAIALILAGFLNVGAHAQMQTLPLQSFPMQALPMQALPMQGVQMPPMGMQGFLTGNLEADHLIKQMGVAAACGMASNAAQGPKGGMDDVMQGAISAFCGMQNPMANVGMQNPMANVGIQAGNSVDLAPITLNGFGGGMVAMPMAGGMLPNVMPVGFNPVMSTGQFDLENMAGQIAGAVVANAVQKALEGPVQNTMNATNASNFGPIATGGLMNAGFGAPNLQNVVGAAVGAYAQQKIMGTNVGANSVAGLSVVQGIATPVMGYAYRPTTHFGAQTNLTLSPQSGIRTGMPLVMQTYNVNGQTFVDTRPLNELMGNGGLRLASGAEAPAVGMR
ncbi:MAG: hypothetical protein ACK5YK_00425, partial [Pseudomonadota bacterium]